MFEGMMDVAKSIFNETFGVDAIIDGISFKIILVDRPLNISFDDGLITMQGEKLYGEIADREIAKKITDGVRIKVKGLTYSLHNPYFFPTGGVKVQMREVADEE